MSPTLANLNLTSFSAQVVIPSAGNNYHVQNLAFAHWLDNSDSETVDGNPILAWSQNSPETSNQNWTYLTYPNTAGETVFTLQALNTVESPSSINGRGGFVRVDPTTNKLVQGGAPFAWQLVQVSPGIYKFAPFDNIFSNNGTLVATDITGKEDIASTEDTQVALQPDINSLEQFWAFN